MEWVLFMMLCHSVMSGPALDQKTLDYDNRVYDVHYWNERNACEETYATLDVKLKKRK